MTNGPWDGVFGLLREVTKSGATVGVAVCVRTVDEVLWTAETGMAEVCPRVRPVVPGQVWDLASLTKVLATASICARLVDQGVISLDQPLSSVLAGVPEGVTVARCLDHTSGYPAWRPLVDVPLDGQWGDAEARAHLFSHCIATPLVATPGSVHRYSDIGMLVLGAFLERVTGMRLDRLWTSEVAIPTGVDLRWGWPNAAATEDCPVRRRMVVGEVHDLNAACFGGIASHAGLFGSVSSVAALGAAALGAWQGRGWISEATQRAFFSWKGVGSHHLGWDGVTPGASSAGPRWPLDGVGHLGFTGGSLWIAPRQGVVVAVLANRVHPLVEGGAVPHAPLHPRYANFKNFRPAVHTAIVDALQQQGWSWGEPAGLGENEAARYKARSRFGENRE